MEGRPIVLDAAPVVEMLLTTGCLEAISGTRIVMNLLVQGSRILWVGRHCRFPEAMVLVISGHPITRLTEDEGEVQVMREISQRLLSLLLLSKTEDPKHNTRHQ